MDKEKNHDRKCQQHQQFIGELNQFFKLTELGRERPPGVAVVEAGVKQSEGKGQ
jgi:hypothetical protein